MNLLVVTQYYYPEPFRITEICETLAARGHHVHVITSVPNVPDGQFYEGYGWFRYGEKERNGVSIERCDCIKRGNNSGLRWALNCTSFLITSFFHTFGKKRDGFDAVLVFNNSPITTIVPAARIARRLKIPLITWVLDLWPESMFFLIGIDGIQKHALFKRAARSYCNHLYRKCDWILMSSKGFEKKIRDTGFTGQIRYFPNFAEETAESEQRSREEVGFGPDDFVIGFAGNVGRAQGLDYTVAATEQLAEPKLRWLIVGDGPDLVHLKELIAEKGLGTHYRFTGRVPGTAVPGYLGICDCLFVPLMDQEVLNLTVPAKVQTYMKSGRPLIAFMNGAGADVVREARCGVTASAESVEELCDAIRGVLTLDKDALIKMGERGREYCRENFDRDSLITKLEGYLREAVELYRGK